MDKVHKPITTQYYTLSSKSFRIYLLKVKKVNFTLEHSIECAGGEVRCSCTLQPRRQMWVGGERHAWQRVFILIQQAFGL
jgi:hypothetical protein